MVTKDRVQCIKKVYAKTGKLKLFNKNEITRRKVTKRFVVPQQTDATYFSVIPGETYKISCSTSGRIEYINELNNNQYIERYTNGTYTLTIPDYVFRIRVAAWSNPGYIEGPFYEECYQNPNLELSPSNITPEFVSAMSEYWGTEESSFDDLRTDRTLVWSEEFTGAKVDESVWQWEVGNARRGYLKEKDMFINSFVRNGELVLRLVRDHPVSDKSWSGSIMRSCGGFEFLYGRIEAKIKFPSKGGYMSFWLMGINATENFTNDDTADGTCNSGYGWPKCGEIDIAESDSGKVSCTVHYQNAEGNHAALSGVSNYCADSMDGYHVYALERTPEKVSVYLDDSLVFEFDITVCTVDGFNPFQLPMHVVLSTLPGVSGGIGTPPDENVNLIDGYVQWVRCYAPEGIENVSPTGLIIEDNSDGTYVEMTVNEEKIPSFTFFPENVTNQTLVWNSSNPEVATVCKFGGYIKAVSAGYATITATAWNGVQNSIIVHVS